MQLNSQIRNRVKRLLDTDRALGRNKRASDPEKARYAFYSREMPGRGYENLFSEFEAFALLMALRLMGLGLPQGVVVTLLRRLRPQLERQHRQIVRLATAGPLAELQIPRQGKPGDLAFDATDPRFIVIVWEGNHQGIEVSGTLPRAARSIRVVSAIWPRLRVYIAGTGDFGGCSFFRASRKSNRAREVAPPSSRGVFDYGKEAKYLKPIIRFHITTQEDARH